MEFKKYDKIRALGEEENKDIFSDGEDEVVVQEKIDGANFRFCITKDKRIIFGSRTQQLTSDGGEDTNVEKNFKRCVNFVRERFEGVKDEIPEGVSNLIYFGENCVRHTINYDWTKIPPFLGFDIYDIRTGKYLDFELVEELYSHLNLDVVPLIRKCKVQDLGKIDKNIIPISLFASPSSKDNLAEGVVIKNYSKQQMAKVVREKFKEKNRGVFGGSKKWAKTDDEYFIAVYCTNARIDKCIFKLLDDGKELGMSLMGELVRAVYKDIWEENWEEISISKKKIDLLEFKRLVSKRCLESLKQTLTNNSPNKV
jgi:hypothetical protein